MSCRCKETKAGLEIKKRQEFRDKYKQEHILCPKCLGKSNIITRFVFPVNLDDLSSYKDLNRCECTECGNKHTVSERLI